MTRSFKFTLLAAGLFAGAVLLANIGLPEYSHFVHPLGLRGATGLPGAMVFNTFAFILPALLLILAANGMRSAMSDSRAVARVGIVLVQLSALAFGAQGVFQLDQQDMDAASSRLHALAWMLWWIAFVPGVLLLAIGARRGVLFTLASLLVGLLVPLIAVFAPIGLWVGLAQRLAFGLWLGWWLCAAWRLTCASASGPGSSKTARR